MGSRRVASGYNGTPNGRSATSPGPQTKAGSRPKDYTSEGVKNNDSLSLPSSDWNILLGLTFVALLVRLFRIYQPSSVVFDEVQ